MGEIPASPDLYEVTAVAVFGDSHQPHPPLPGAVFQAACPFLFASKRVQWLDHVMMVPRVKSIIFTPSTGALRRMFIRAETNTMSALPKESESVDEKNIKRLIGSCNI